MTSCICAGLSWGDLKLVWRRRRLPIRRGPFNVPPPPPDPSEDTDPVLDQEDTPIWYTHTHTRDRETQAGLFPLLLLLFFSFLTSRIRSEARTRARDRGLGSTCDTETRAIIRFTGVTGSMTIFSLTNRRHFSHRELPVLDLAEAARRYVDDTWSRLALN